MGTPDIAQKRLLAAGAVKSDQSWGTAKAIPAGGGMLIDSDGGLVRNQAYHPAAEADTPFVMEGDLGQIDPVDFAPEFFMRYDPGGIGIILAQLFGTAGSPSAVGTGQRHFLQWATENYGEFCTFAVERPNKIFEVPSAKPYMFDLSIADGFLRGSLGLRGDTLINTGTENEDTEMDALTYADRGNRIKFSDLIVYLRDQDLGAPSGTTALEVSDISMHFERPQDAIHGAGGAGIIEPAENAHSIITITLNFPRMNTVNDAYFANFIAETPVKKAFIWFSGAFIDGVSGQKYEFHFYFPRLRIINIEYPWDPIVPATMTLQAEEASSNPTGFSYAVPYLRMVNTRSTDYLG